MKLTKEKIKLINSCCYVVLLVLMIRLMVVYALPWIEVVMIVIAMAGVFWTQRILNLSDGMLYQMLKLAEKVDPITDKILQHTHKKKNKRYKVRKKRPRQAR